MEKYNRKQLGFLKIPEICLSLSLNLAMWSDWANWSNCEVEDDVSAIRRKRSCMVFNAETDAFEENADSIGHRHCREGDHVEAVDCYEEECPAV